MLCYRKPAVLLIIAALLVCAVVAVCFLSDPVSGGKADTSSEPSEPSVDAELKAEDFYPFYGTLIEQDFSTIDLIQLQTPPIDVATLERMVSEAENADLLSAEHPTHLPVFRIETEKAWNRFRKTYDISVSDTEFDTFTRKYGHLFEDHVLILLYAPNGMAARGIGNAYQCDGRLVQVFRGTGMQTAGEPGSLHLYFLPRSELARYPKGPDAVVYPAGKPVILPDGLPYDPVQRLAELEERDQWGSTNGFFYLEGVLAGEIDPTAPKLDEETARSIIASYGTQPESFEKIMKAFCDVQPFPDWSGGSGFALAEYWFDDMGDEGLFINLTTRSIFYYVTAPDGSQLPELQEELFPCRS